MSKPKAKAELIPRRKREQLAAPLLQIVRKAFEDPQIAKEFKEWQEAKEKQRRAQA